jgi:drug/metabolite transporter (DMT)-like permease
MGRAPAWLVWAALIVVYLVWGSTYLAIAVVVKSMPPLLAAGARFVMAGAAMALVIGALRGWHRLRLTRQELVASGLVGLALLLGGNGLVMLGERSITSGLAALIIGIVPLWIVLLRVVYAERVQRGTLAGVLLGFGGMALLVSRGLSGEVNLTGTLMVIGASVTWAAGSYFSRRLAMPTDPFVSSAAQMLSGGIALLVVGAATGELTATQLTGFAPESVAALFYLVIFGSIITYSAYTWLLQNAPVSKVATYAYVNPVVAIVLGWLILAEPVSPSMLAGAALILAAVVLVIRTEARPRPVAHGEPLAPAPAVSPSRPV